MRIMTKQQIAANGPKPLLLQARDKNGKNIKPVDSIKVLGVTVHKNLMWNTHLNKGQESLVSK